MVRRDLPARTSMTHAAQIPIVPSKSSFEVNIPT